MELLEILKIIAGVFFTLTVAVPLIPYLVVRRRLKNLPRKTTDELKAMFSPLPNPVYIGPALKELRSRNVDIVFALPAILDMALSSNPNKYILFRGILRNYFSDRLPGIDLSEHKLSKETLKQLADLRGTISEHPLDNHHDHSS